MAFNKVMDCCMSDDKKKKKKEIEAFLIDEKKYRMVKIS